MQCTLSHRKHESTTPSILLEYFVSGMRPKYYFSSPSLFLSRSRSLLFHSVYITFTMEEKMILVSANRAAYSGGIEGLIWGIGGGTKQNKPSPLGRLSAIQPSVIERRRAKWSPAHASPLNCERWEAKLTQKPRKKNINSIYLYDWISFVANLMDIADMG